MYAIDLNIDPRVSLETWNFTSVSPEGVLVSWSCDGKGQKLSVHSLKGIHHSIPHIYPLNLQAEMRFKAGR